MKILLADGNTLHRNAIKQLLSSLENLASILEVANTTQLFAICRNNPNLDLILLDPELPDNNNNELIIELKKILPRTAIVIFSEQDDYNKVTQAFEAGAKGYIPKSISYDILKYAISIIIAGGIYIPESLIKTKQQVKSIPFEKKPTFNITLRQQEILELICNGYSNKNISTILGLSESTIRTHLTALFKTLQVSNRVEASNFAISMGLITKTV